MIWTKAKVALGLLLLANVKVWPLMYHVRFYYYCVKYFLFQRFNRETDLWAWSSYWTYTPLMEMDFNLHKSNSTYFCDMDMSRSKLLVKMFKEFFLKYQEADGPKLKWYQLNYAPLGGVALTFRHEIGAYVPYNVQARVFGWTSKWLYVLVVFKVGDKVHAYGLSKYVFKLKRKTVAPEQVLKWCNLWSEEAARKNAALEDELSHSLSLEDTLEKLANL